MPSLLLLPSAPITIWHPLSWCVISDITVFPWCLSWSPCQFALHSVVTSFSGSLVSFQLMRNSQQGADSFLFLAISFVVNVAISYTNFEAYCAEDARFCCLYYKGWSQAIRVGWFWLCLHSLFCWMGSNRPCLLKEYLVGKGMLAVVNVCNGSCWRVQWWVCVVGKEFVVGWYSSITFGRVSTMRICTRLS